MAVQQGNVDVAPPARVDVREATLEDLKQAIGSGLSDFAARPGLSMFFGLVYALFGALLISGLVVFDQMWIVISAGVGFPLVAPFLAAGLYEMSRRLKGDAAFSASDIFLVIFRQQRREFGWMAFVVLFVFWIWAYQVRIVLVIVLQHHSFSSFSDFVTLVFTTVPGATFLVIGTVVGAILSAVLFSITVIAMPLLLDKNIDFVTAMLTSVKAVQKSPVVMLSWGATIGGLTLLAVAPGLLGVLVVFPILGHITWHLYEKLVFEP